MARDRGGTPLRILQCGGTEIDSGAAGCQGCRQRLVIADATRELYFHIELAYHLCQQLAVGTTTEGRIQVHQMHPLGTVVLPRQSRIAG
ncbi:Uncharacterised protein [Mycobacteroides abscessus subsp. massiliense]|nr:Uncharacterised protein [Mycobacteroides abscessus subsp. massiliense]